MQRWISLIAISQMLLLLQISVHAVEQGEEARLLRDCFNKHYNATPPMFEDFLTGFNTSLYLHKVWWSSKPARLPLTIFVGATLERLGALEAQCRAYPGPHSAALYVPLLQPKGSGAGQLTADNQKLLQQAVDQVDDLFKRMESYPSSCSLRVLLLYEAVADAALARLLPVNTLRNAALLPCATPLAAMVDVDLAPSRGLPGELAEEGARLSQLLRSTSQRLVWVMPAWETDKRLGLDKGAQVADKALAGDKSTLFTLVSNGRLHYFAEHVYARGHAATNSSRWLKEHGAYNVSYEINYEPWFIIDRLLSPAYDVRFRGYGWNKVAQVALVAHSNFTFAVHPRVWLVHRPHPPSSGQALYTGVPQQGGAAGGSQDGKKPAKQADEIREWKGSRVPVSRLFHRRVSSLRHVVIRDMMRGKYVPVVDPQVAHCRQVLPWWGQAADTRGRTGR